MLYVLAEVIAEPVAVPPEVSPMDAVVNGLIILWPLASGIVLLLAFKGMLGRRAFAQAPARRVDMGAGELGVVIALFLLVQVGVPLVVMMSGLIRFDEAGVAIELTPQIQAAFNVIVQIAMLLLFGLFLVFWPTIGPAGLRQLGFVPRRPLGNIGVGLLGTGTALILGMTIMQICIAVTLLWGVPPPETGHDLLQLMTQTPSPAVRITLIVSAVIIAPLIEEIIYRVTVQTCFVHIFGAGDEVGDLPLNGLTARWWAILITAGIFTLMHNASVPWQTLPALLIVGIVLGYIYERTGSVLAIITAHAGFNALNVIMALWAAKYAA